MGQESHLAQLYMDVFGEEPSQVSRVALRRMQAVLGLKQGDTFSRMLIVQLRSADQVDQTRQRLEEVIASIAPMLTSARTLAYELSEMRSDIARANRRIPLIIERATVKIDVFRKALPLFSYLANAFRWRRPTTDIDEYERIGAARVDMFFQIMLLLLAGMFGAELHKLFS